jgi:uncharacterized glyoxalase superfamily protein PhnB
MGINVLLMVESASRSLEFYRRLGFQEQMLIRHQGQVYYGEMAFENGSDSHLIMFLEKSWWAFPQDRQGTPLGTGVVLYILVDNIDDLYVAVRDQARIVQPLQDAYYGREFVLADEDGYRLAFIQQYAGGEKITAEMEIWRRE